MRQSRPMLRWRSRNSTRDPLKVFVQSMLMRRQSEAFAKAGRKLNFSQTCDVQLFNQGRMPTQQTCPPSLRNRSKMRISANHHQVATKSRERIIVGQPAVSVKEVKPQRKSIFIGVVPPSADPRE